MVLNIGRQEQIDQYLCSRKSVFALAKGQIHKRQSEAQPKEDFLNEHEALVSPLSLKAITYRGPKTNR
jgi:hypothetical protein